MRQYFGIECDSDEEMDVQDSDVSVCYSEFAEKRTTIDYDLDKMFEIVEKRDLCNWSMTSINKHYRKIAIGSTGRQQISR